MSNNFNDFFSFTKRLSLKNRSNYEKYHYVNDFENTNVKECKKLDKLNEQIYQKNVKYFSHIQKYLNDKKAIFKLNDSPAPPKEPSNYDSLILYRKRNQVFNCRDQTLAIMYLIFNDYTLVIDKTIAKFKDKSKFFEPYMAIELASKIARKRKENFIEVIEKRINDDNEVDEKELEEEVTQLQGSISNLNLPSYQDLVNNSDNINNSNNHNNHHNNHNNHNNHHNNHNHHNNSPNNSSNNQINHIPGLTCSNPEHHSINEKISHFNNTSSFYPNLSQITENNLVNFNHQIPPSGIMPSAPPATHPSSSNLIYHNTSMNQPLLHNMNYNQQGYINNNSNSNVTKSDDDLKSKNKKDKKRKTLKDKINNKSKSSTTYQINIHSNNSRKSSRAGSLSSQSSASDLNV